MYNGSEISDDGYRIVKTGVAESTDWLYGQSIDHYQFFLLFCEDGRVAFMEFYAEIVLNWVVGDC